MKTNKKVLVRATLALGLLAGGGGAAVATAGAASAGGLGDGAGVCGDSYELVDTYPIDNSYGGHERLGEMQLYYSADEHRNCAITTNESGAPMYTVVKMALSNASGPDDAAQDAGFYSQYAGPVYTPEGLDMTGKCVQLRGRIGEGERFGEHTTGDVHCG